MSARDAFFLVSTACALSGCAPDARAQIVVVIDTDAPVIGQLANHPEISPDAAIDTMRVDVLDSNDITIDLQTFIVSDPDAWPLSFGVAQGMTSSVTLRVRLFRGELGSPVTENGTTTIEAPLEVTIERLVRVDFPDAGIQRVRVTMHADCMGTSSSFATPVTTCIDGEHMSGAPTDGIELLTGEALAPSIVGTWPSALEQSCTASTNPDHVCVPGGFTVIGDLTLVGLYDIASDPIPLRPSIISTYWLDRDEYTVGRFRALLATNIFPEAMPMTNQQQEFCTFIDKATATNDTLPLNCLTWSAARQICALEGGMLPSEAQWEHEARGRGEHRTYPWGEADAQCCTASLSRVAVFPQLAECSGTGVEPVASHTPSSACGGIGDVSRDGINDMGGSVAEALVDVYEPYGSPCWAGAILHDPVCTTTDTRHSQRGADWTAGLGTPFGALRLTFTDNGITNGLRCAYASAQ